MPRWLLPFLAGAAVVALVAVSTVAVVQYRSARDARADAAEAREQVEELQQRVDALEAELEGGSGDDDGGATDPFGGLLDGLLGGEGAGGMEDLLGQLMGGADGIPGAECLLPGGSGGLGGLLGGDAGDLFSGDAGGLEDLIGDLFGGGSPSAPADPSALVDQTADEVAELRELAWEQDVDVEFLDDDAMRERLLEVFDEEYGDEDAEVEGRVLAALGAIPPTTDVMDMRRQLYEEQVAGFYDPETGELVVRMPGGEVGPADRITLAHELDHALTDQALGLPDLEADRFADDDDALLAALAIVEGDASLLMNQWALGSLGLGEQLSMATDPNLLAAQESLDEMPPYLGAELLFPYTTGLDHVCDRWQDGGWDTVDAAYQDLPDTTATVLWDDHPGRTGEPTALAAPGGFEEQHTTTFGAAQLLWLLQAPGGDDGAALDDPDARARAWGGGALTLWTDGPDSAVGVSLVDSGAGSATLCDTVTDWYGTAFPDSGRGQEAGTTTFDGDAQAAAVACDDDQVHLGIAPDLATATQVAAARPT